MALSCAPSGPGTGRSAELSLAPRAGEEARARRALEDLDLPSSILDDAKLLVTELVTNSIKHSGITPEERVRVSVRWDGAMLHVDVYDRPGAPLGPGPVVGGIRPAPGAESGWGLFLMDRLATRWGNAPGHYWFELTL